MSAVTIIRGDCHVCSTSYISYIKIIEVGNGKVKIAEKITLIWDWFTHLENKTALKITFDIWLYVIYDNHWFYFTHE